MKSKSLLASLAVSSLVLAQPVAAATRSYESLPVKGIESAQVERTGASVAESEATAGGTDLWLVFAALALSILLVVVVTGGTDSPG